MGDEAVRCSFFQQSSRKTNVQIRGKKKKKRFATHEEMNKFTVNVFFHSCRGSRCFAINTFPSAFGQSPSACIFVQKCTANQQKDNVQHKPVKN